MKGEIAMTNDDMQVLSHFLGGNFEVLPLHTQFQGPREEEGVQKQNRDWASDYCSKTLIKRMCKLGISHKRFVNTAAFPSSESKRTKTLLPDKNITKNRWKFIRVRRD